MEQRFLVIFRNIDLPGKYSLCFETIGQRQWICFVSETIINHPLLNPKAKEKNPFYEVRTSSNSFGTEGGCFGARYLSGTYPHGMGNIDYNINNYDVTLKLRK